MITFEITKWIDGVLMPLRVKLYSNDTVAVNRINLSTGIPAESIDPKKIGL